ncbi:MAG: CDP-glycerol glycerophosphotransferase family protein [Patescibacteria group bacterium]
MSRTTLYLDFVEPLGSGRFKIEGYLGGGGSATLKDLQLMVNGSKQDIEYVKRNQEQEGIDGHNPLPKTTFTAEIVTKDKAVLAASLQGRKIAIKCNRFTRLPNLLIAYKKTNGHLVVRTAKSIRFIRYSRPKHAFLELLTILSVAFNWRLATAAQRVSTAKSRGRSVLSEGAKGVFVTLESMLEIPRALLLRLMYWTSEWRSSGRAVWLFSDRVTSAGDNGEALFRYAAAQKDLPADIYFVISRKTQSYKELQQIGRVVAYGSLKHLLVFLRAHMVISSHADIEVINPFLRQADKYRNLFRFKFIFLQHGVIRHDLSSWLNRYNRNIDLFITSSQVEYDSILSNPYYYSSDSVLLSGLPRHDSYESAPDKTLLIMPTHRAYLLKGRVLRSGARPYSESFKDSRYRNFYNDLINDPKLHAALDRNGMRAEFYLHPALAAQERDFSGNKHVEIMSYPHSYRRAYKHGSILVSDHSSVIFDFVYLSKPVLYAHFDNEEFYENHTYTKSDFFDDERDGFGPVCTSYDGLVGELIKQIDAGCKLKGAYKKRAGKYFAYKDKHNSKRVYDAIIDRARQQG